MTTTPNPVVIPDGFLLATAKWQLSGRPRIYTVQWGANYVNGDDPNTVANNINTRFKVPFSAANTIVGYTYLGIDVICNDAGVMREGSKADSVVGTYAVGPPAPNVSLLVAKRTGRAGRQFRGRWFLPAAFVDEGGIDANGLILAATLATLQARVSAWLAAEATATQAVYILHRALVRDSSQPPPAMKPNPNADLPTAVTSMTWEQMVATQRRRLR